MNCILCHTPDAALFSDAFKCAHCGLVFKNPEIFLSSEEDFKRYATHQNNSEDQGYINFLNRLLNPMTPFLPSVFTSLDYGSGPGPTLSLLIKEKGAHAFHYDPLFHPDKNALKEKYDVVTSTEVVEHFKNPAESWRELVGLVKPQGLLGIMTQFLSEDIDYKKWWYKNDPTHIAFYNNKTFAFLAKEFNLEVLFNDNVSVIIFRKK